jgi:hypothetical protein
MSDKKVFTLLRPGDEFEIESLCDWIKTWLLQSDIKSDDQVIVEIVKQ